LSLHHCLLKYFDRAAREPGPEAMADSLEDSLRRLYAGSRILVVEDEPINQLVAQDLLAEVGMVVDVANNGQEALEKLEKGAYRMVLMDLQMPRMGGLEATRRIRLLPGQERLPIVAMTANAFNDDRDLCYSAGMNDFLPKPVVPELLFAVLFKWLQEDSMVRCQTDNGPLVAK